MKLLITHNGQFHADDVLAYTILNIIYPKNKLVRTRDETIIKTGNIVFDVGGQYNVKKHLFDHHQKDCHTVFDNNNTVPLSSAGMIYKKYGQRLVKKIVDSDSIQLFNDFYTKFILQFDALDNGISNYEYPQKYQLTSLTTIINMANNSDVYDDDEQHKRFINCSKILHDIMLIVLNNINIKINSKSSDYDKMEKYMESRENPCIVVVKEDIVTWLDCIKEYEKTNSKKVKFIVYPSNEEWRVKSIFNRHNLKTQEELSTLMSNPQDIIFVHKKQFIGSCKTIKSAIEMAEYSLTNSVFD